MELDYDSGIYLLEIFLHKPKKIEIGKKGINTFPPGYYYYVGTAQKNLQARIERHLSREKRYHWHIDYLLNEANLQEYFTWPVGPESECELASYLQEELSGEVIVPGFGASDCDCESHLFYFQQPLDRGKLPEKNFFEEWF